MRERIWYELTQAKHNHQYSCFLLSYWRRVVNIFNIIIFGFSTGGVMGWAFWKVLPLTSCIIIAGISLLRLLQPHLIPMEKQIDKLDQVADFYFDYYNQLEILWFDWFNLRINDVEAQRRFYEIKATEKTINKTVNEIIRGKNKEIRLKAETESRNYLKRTFNTQ